MSVGSKLFLGIFLFFIMVSFSSGQQYVSSNILVNPSFEKGDGFNATGWAQEATYGTLEGSVERNNRRSVEGSWSIRQVGITNSYGREFLSEPVEVLPGKKYDFGASYYLVGTGETPQDYTYSVRVRWLDQQQKKIDEEPYYGDSFTVFDSWERFRFSETAPGDAEYAQLRIRSKYEGTESTDVYWDGAFINGDDPSSNKESSDINVTVAEEVAVDITPSQLEYRGVEPGSVYTESDNSHGFSGLEVRNIGSVGLDQVWLETTTPSTNPFGTGAASNYDPGNFVTVRAPGDGYRSFVNRKEFSERGEGLNFINKPSDSWSEGRFKQGPNEHFYVIEADGGICDGSNSHEVRVGKKLHNDSQTGTTDFVNGDYYSYTLTSSTTDYGVIPEVQVGDRNYTVMTKCGGSEPSPDSITYRTVYNPEMNGADLGAGAPKYLTDGLLPGETYGFEVALEIPLGVAEGQISNGQLTVKARR